MNQKASSLIDKLSNDEVQKLTYPAIFHFRIIAVVQSFNKSELVNLAQSYHVTDPLTAARISSNGRYQAYSLSIEMQNFAELQAFDTSVKLISGVQLVL